MFNVNNTYIRISGCIINVPLNQDDKKVITTEEMYLAYKILPNNKDWKYATSDIINLNLPINTSTIQFGLQTKFFNDGIYVGEEVLKVTSMYLNMDNAIDVTATELSEDTVRFVVENRKGGFVSLDVYTDGVNGESLENQYLYF